MEDARLATESETREPLAIWREALGPLLAGEEARELMGASSEEFAALEVAGELIVLTATPGNRYYPVFQFKDGVPLTGLVRAHAAVAEAASVWTAASWAVSPHPELDGHSPRAWAAAGRDPEMLVLVAGRDAARFEH